VEKAIGAESNSSPREVKNLVEGKLSKTYKCDICGQEVKVTKEGGGILVCCGKPMREL